MLAATSLVVGAAVTCSFAVLAFGASLLVLETSSVAGVAPTTVMRVVVAVAVLTSAVGFVAGILALWRGHVDGAGVGGRAVIGLVTSSMWLVAVCLGFGSADGATRDGGLIDRPGFLSYADLEPGDCLVKVPPVTYDSPEDRVYAVRCDLSHRAQVMSVPSFRVEFGDTSSAAAEAACAAAPAAVDLGPADRVVAVHAVGPTRSRSGMDRLVCVVAHVDDRRVGAPWGPDGPPAPLTGSEGP